MMKIWNRGMRRLKRFFGHLSTVIKHKWYVFILCGKCGYPLRGLRHDNSKFSLTEFIPSVRYFTGTSSPIDAEIADKGYSLAWLHHKGRNPHHWEYWIDKIGTRENIARKMPYKYVVEMVCDWLAAGIVYGKKKVNFNESYPALKEYYNKCKGERIFHKDVQEMIEQWLDIIETFGINFWCTSIKEGDKK